MSKTLGVVDISAHFWAVFAGKLNQDLCLISICVYKKSEEAGKKNKNLRRLDKNSLSLVRPDQVSSFLQIS